MRNRRLATAASDRQMDSASLGMMGLLSGILPQGGEGGEAKAAHRDLWSQPNPIPPWSLRKGDGVPGRAEIVGNRRTHVYHGPHCRGVAVMKAENKVEFKTGE